MIKKLQGIVLTTTLVLSNLTGTIYAAKLKDDERKIYVLEERIQDENDISELNKKSHSYLKSKVVDTKVLKDKKYEAAYNNAKKTYDYFNSNFAIKGIDGKGLVPYILPNAAIYNAGIYPQDKPMILLGSPHLGISGSKSYAYATDVVAHEYTHGVLYYKYKLSPEGKGRVIHEGLSDYFGSIVEGKNWTIGEHELATDGYLRDIKNPASICINGRSYFDTSNFRKITLGNSYRAANGKLRQTYPSHYSHRSLESDVKSGYINSTIVSHLMYLIARGDDSTFKGIGNVAAGKLAFSAIGSLTDLTVDGYRHATIETFADAIMRKASSSQKDTVTKAFKKVGLSDVRSIGISNTSSTLKKGQSLKLSVTIQPSYATNKNVTWSSSNTKVATVDSNGTVKAVGKGTATITVTTKDGNKKSTCKVTVDNPVVSVTGVKLNSTSRTLTTGKTEKLTATISPSNATNKNVTWSSGNPKVAIVDSNGTVKALGKGTATITVTTKDGSKKAICTVTVNTPVVSVSSVKLNKTSAKIVKGKTDKLTATINPSNSTNKNVTWSSSNTKVATVDSNGTVKAIGKGTATITVRTKDGSKKATCKVTVTNPYKTRTVKFTVNLPKGFKQKHYVEILDGNNKVIWTSAAPRTGSSSYSFTYQLDTSSSSYSRKIRIRTVSGNKKYDSNLFKINSSTINKNVTATFTSGTTTNSLKTGKITQK